MSLTLVRDGDAAELLATRPAVLVARARELLGGRGGKKLANWWAE